MNKKKLVSILIGICLVALGFAGGTYVGWMKLGKATRSMERLFSLAGYSQYVLLEYQNANYSEAKKALLQFIAILDKEKKIKGIDSYDYRMCQVDSILTYGRLAIVEEKHGNSSESEKYMANATSICQEVKWKDCSPNKIRQFVDRLDSNLKDKE